VARSADRATGDKEAVMRVVALISWIVTALAGATLFSIWLARGGLRRQGPGASRFPPALILGHPILAATGLVIWIIYVATGTEALAWIALVLLLGVAVLGFTMVTRWRQERAALAVAPTGSSAGAERPAE
jgi:manganese efflux pump family protein